MIVPTPEWEGLVHDLEGTDRPGTVFLLGASDCGKTTLARWISTQMRDVAYIDGDPGQSVLGPPGTLGLELPDGRVRLRFTGAFSPSHALLATLVSLRRLLDAAVAEGPEVVLVDSCGYIWGDGGVEFQRRSIEILKPDAIVAIGRQAEIGRILAPFPAIQVHRLPPAPAARRRSQGERRRYRAERFARHMEGAEKIVVGPGVHRIGHAPTPGHFAALLDADGWVLTAGTVAAAGPEGVTLTAAPPAPDTPAYLEVADFRPDLPPRYLQEE
ncbi:Clp1/GlmU family protein [Methanofollis sp. UBA420]|jgi:polynucleotide 5'-kinase involved in rRNA processing|uniref:Clp1/GlmU family protein n=1 Tax=Methanofollis sp. UBA420 TaxID=1915514 RepID=UPI00316AC3B7